MRGSLPLTFSFYLWSWQSTLSYPVRVFPEKGFTSAILIISNKVTPLSRKFYLHFKMQLSSFLWNLHKFPVRCWSQFPALYTECPLPLTQSSIVWVLFIAEIQCRVTLLERNLLPQRFSWRHVWQSCLPLFFFCNCSSFAWTRNSSNDCERLYEVRSHFTLKFNSYIIEVETMIIISS